MKTRMLAVFIAIVAGRLSAQASPQDSAAKAPPQDSAAMAATRAVVKDSAAIAAGHPQAQDSVAMAAVRAAVKDSAAMPAGRISAQFSAQEWAAGMGIAPKNFAAAFSDSAAIRATALDYIEGYYEGNGERMERALHPELVKRIVRTNERGLSSLGQLSAMGLVQGTRSGGGQGIPADRQQKDVTILDIYNHAATAKIVASEWVDYLQLAKWNGRWVIVNVLWELKPPPQLSAQ